MRPPRVSESTTYVQKSKSASTSSASWVSPSRLERTAAPARSWVVKIRPTRPRAAWLWLVWSASVDLPESIVPVKKCSSAMSRRSCHSGRPPRRLPCRTWTRTLRRIDAIAAEIAAERRRQVSRWGRQDHPSAGPAGTEPFVPVVERWQGAQRRPDGDRRPLLGRDPPGGGLRGAGRARSRTTTGGAAPGGRGRGRRDRGDRPSRRR